MNLNEYQEFCWSLFNDDIKNSFEDSLVYLSAKLSSEISEALEAYLYKPDVDMFMELGDVAWYIAALHELFDKDWTIEYIYEKRNESCQESYNNILIQSNNILGEACKQKWHGKDIDLERIQTHLKQASQFYFELLRTKNISIDTITDANYLKLTERHGTSFNKEFYSNE